MADKKISALTSATTPLAGTEVLPIVQSGSTVKVAVSDLTAGRAISATQVTLTAGNVIFANGYGVDFSATSGSGTSELLNDYEEGTWAPTYLGLTTAGTTTYNVSNGLYVKVGQMVTVTGLLVWSSATGTGSAALGGLPFTINNSAGDSDGSVWIGTESGYTIVGQLGALLVRGGNTAYLQVYNVGAATAASVINGSVALRFAFSYRSN